MKIDPRRIEVIDDQMAALWRSKTGADRIAIGKMDAFREGGSDKHLRDIASVLKVSGPSLDRGYIEQQTKAEGLSEIWNAILTKTEPPRTF
jgi:hypothetical protein